MKRPSSRIREEIARLQEQLKHAETREAERIGRLALRAGIGEIVVEDTELLAGFEELADRFRADQRKPTGKKNAGAGGGAGAAGAAVTSGADAGSSGEA
jgi:hypothetical protein